MPSSHIDCTVNVAGKEIAADEVHDILVECDLDQPDMASVILSNASTRYSEQVNEGDDIEVKLGFVEGAASNSVFKGEVTGVEPIYDSRGPARVVIRALNQLHRLTRGKKSVAHKQVTDKDIVDKVCQAYGLTAKFGDTPPTTKYEHVYQHNMSDLEFLRLRAARLGFEIFVSDKELNFRKRIDADSGITLEFGLSGANVLDVQIDTGTDQQFNKSAGATQTYQVVDGDRLDLIAAKCLGDAGRWPEIAAFNDIVDPGNIADGNGNPIKTLTMPKD